MAVIGTPVKSPARHVPPHAALQGVFVCVCVCVCVCVHVRVRVCACVHVWHSHTYIGH